MTASTEIEKAIESQMQGLRSAADAWAKLLHTANNHRDELGRINQELRDENAALKAKLAKKKSPKGR